ncbi:MAG: type IV secretory system conjugative DNA transfer family protein, partial [Psychrosphaera sp.]|nr:type IV secretory system conjugative DNA transfer family protein [Psychrosphaera sp.]
MDNLTPEWLILLSVVLVVGLALVRSVLLLILRSCGLHHPILYSYWPRLPWRSLYQLWMVFALWRERVFRMGRFATGGFANIFSILTNLYRPDTVFLGRAYGLGVGWLQPVGIPVTRHIFCLAITGGGKTTWLISCLATWKGSAWLIDPKGQVSFALKDKDSRTWVVLAPYDENTDKWNPFDDLKAAMKREGISAGVKWATRIAASLIVTPSGSRSPYFTDMARSFVTSLILHILTFHDEKCHTLGYMRQLIIHGYIVKNDDGSLDSTPEESRALLFKMMMGIESFNGAIAGGAAGLQSASGETSGNVMSTLQEQTKWLDLPSVAAMLETTTRPLSDLKTRDDIVLSFCAPVLSIREELAPLTRLLTNMTAYTFESVKDKKGQCLTIVDELQAQGYNQTIEVVLPVGRSYGQTFIGIAQDLEGMKNAYPKTYQAFMGNADATLWMGSAHPENLNHLSKLLGTTALKEKDKRTGRTSYRTVSVLEPDQVGRLLTPESGTIIVTRAGKRAMRLKNDPYFSALPITHYSA